MDFILAPQKRRNNCVAAKAGDWGTKAETIEILSSPSETGMDEATSDGEFRPRRLVEDRTSTSRLLDFSTSLESREPRQTLGAIRIGPPSPESRLCHCCRRIDQRYPRCHCLMFRTPGKSLASPMMGSTRLGNASTSIFQKPSHVARFRPRLHPAKQTSGNIKERLDGWDNASKGSRPSSVTPSSYSDPQITQGAQALVP